MRFLLLLILIFEFVRAFDVNAFADGDTPAGLNRLTAMAVTLANLARPGSGIRCKESRRLIPVGADLLVSGPSSCGLVIDDVTLPVGRIQARWLAHLERLRADAAIEYRKTTGGRGSLAQGRGKNKAQKKLFSLLTQPDEPLPYPREEEWAGVLTMAPSSCAEDFLRQPRLFLTAGTPQQLVPQLGGAHGGQALVHLGIARAGDFGKFADHAPPLMDGCLPAGPAGAPVHGRLLLTDPGQTLRQAATQSGDRTAWIDRLIWLVDESPGTALPAASGDASIVRLHEVAERFELAILFAFGKRLDDRGRPSVRVLDFEPFQERWLSFLSSMETRLPGITGKARHLLASVAFGVSELVHADLRPAGFRFRLHGIEELARLIVLRMADAREHIAWSAAEAGLIQIMRKMLEKLATAGEPLDPTELQRKFHKLDAATRDRALARLLDDNWVQREGGRFTLLRDPEEFPKLSLMA